PAAGALEAVVHDILGHTANLRDRNFARFEVILRPPGSKTQHGFQLPLSPAERDFLQCDTPTLASVLPSPSRPSSASAGWLGGPLPATCLGASAGSAPCLRLTVTAGENRCWSRAPTAWARSWKSPLPWESIPRGGRKL